MSARKVLEALFKSLEHCWGSRGSGELFEQLIGHSSSILSTEEDFNFIRRACTASMSLQAYSLQEQDRYCLYIDLHNYYYIFTAIQ